MFIEDYEPIIAFANTVDRKYTSTDTRHDFYKYDNYVWLVPSSGDPCDDFGIIIDDALWQYTGIDIDTHPSETYCVTYDRKAGEFATFHHRSSQNEGFIRYLGDYAHYEVSENVYEWKLADSFGSCSLHHLMLSYLVMWEFANA